MCSRNMRSGVKATPCSALASNQLEISKRLPIVEDNPNSERSADLPRLGWNSEGYENALNPSELNELSRHRRRQ